MPCLQFQTLSRYLTPQQPPCLLWPSRRIGCDVAMPPHMICPSISPRPTRPHGCDPHTRPLNLLCDLEPRLNDCLTLLHIRRQSLALFRRIPRDGRVAKEDVQSIKG